MDPDIHVDDDEDENLQVNIRRELQHAEQEDIHRGEEPPAQEQARVVQTLDQPLTIYLQEHTEKMAALTADSLTDFCVSDFVILALHPELREAFVTAFAERKVEEIHFDLEGLHIFNDTADQIHDKHAFSRGFRDVLRSLGRLPIDELGFNGGVPSGLSWVSTIISHCRQIKRLSLNFGGDEVPRSAEPHFWGPVIDQLEEVDLRGLSLNTCRWMSQVLLNMPRLSGVTIGGARGTILSPMLIESIADANVIQSIASIPGLEKLSLSNITLTDSQATASFCESLALSNLKTCYLNDVAFPEESGAMVVNALVRMPLELLAYSVESGTTKLYPEICQGMKQSSTLWSLVLGDSEDDLLDCDELIKWLGDYGQWNRLKYLSLALRNWNTNFENFIAGFVQTQDVRAIVVNFPEGFVWPGRAPEAIIAAIDDGTRCLEYLRLTRWEPSSYASEDISASWCSALQPLLQLNGQRHIHAPAFASVDRAAAASDDALRRKLLVKVLEALDETCLYGFLRRNEWNLQELIKELGCEEEGDVVEPPGNGSTPPPAKRRRMA